MAKPTSNASISPKIPLNELSQELVDDKGRSDARLRSRRQQPLCGFGLAGICCRMCHQGPCRIDPFGNGPNQGICGANADLIAVRHLLQYMVYGVLETLDHLEHQISNIESLSPKDINHPALLKKIRTHFPSKESLSDGLKNALTTSQTPTSILEDIRPLQSQTNSLPKLAIQKKTDIFPLLASLRVGDESNVSQLCYKIVHSGIWGLNTVFLPLAYLKQSQMPLDTFKKTSSGIGLISEKSINIMVLGEDHETLTQIYNLIESAPPKKFLDTTKRSTFSIIHVGDPVPPVTESIRYHNFANIQDQELLAWTGQVDAILITDPKISPGLQSPITHHIIPLFSLASLGPYWQSEMIPDKGTPKIRGLKSLLKAAIFHADNRIQKKTTKTELKYQFPPTLPIQSTSETEVPIAPLIVSAFTNRTIKGVIPILGEAIATDTSTTLITAIRQLLADDWYIVITPSLFHKLNEQGVSIASLSKSMGRGLKKAVRAWKMAGLNSSLAGPIGVLTSIYQAPLFLEQLQNSIKLEKSIPTGMPILPVIPEFYSNQNLLLQIGLAGIGYPVISLQSPPYLGSHHVKQYLSEEIKDIMGGSYTIELNVNKLLSTIQSLIG